jgi:hypothetical protein
MVSGAFLLREPGRLAFLFAPATAMRDIPFVVKYQA